MTDWTPFDGSECPVDDDALVFVRFLGSKVFSHPESQKPKPAGRFCWRRAEGQYRGGSIIAYRLADVSPAAGHGRDPCCSRQAGPEIAAEARVTVADARTRQPVEIAWHSITNAPTSGEA